MRYLVRFEVKIEREPGSGRITLPESWANYSARSVTVDLPDGLSDQQIDAEIEQVAAERGLTRGLLGTRGPHRG